MLKAVTFDFWNTLYMDVDFDKRLKVRVDFLKSNLKKHSFDRSEVQIHTAFEAAGKKWLNLWQTKHKSFSPHDIVKSVLYGLEVDMPEQAVRSLTREMSEIALKVKPRLIDGVRDMLKMLSHEYKLGVISDTAATPGTVLRKIMSEDRIENYFTAFVFSDEIGFTKPTKLNFEKALERLGVEPGFSAHVGDMERTDISGAKSVGMKAVLFAGINGTDVEGSKADLIVKSYDEFSSKLMNL